MNSNLVQLTDPSTDNTVDQAILGPFLSLQDASCDGSSIFVADCLNTQIGTNAATKIMASTGNTSTLPSNDTNTQTNLDMSYRTEQDRTGQNRTQDRTGQDRTGHIQFAVFFSWQLDLSFTFLPAGTLHQVAGESCYLN